MTNLKSPKTIAEALKIDGSYTVHAGPRWMQWNTYGAAFYVWQDYVKGYLYRGKSERLAVKALLGGKK